MTLKSDSERPTRNQKNEKPDIKKKNMRQSANFGGLDSSDVAQKC
jgi:hypothetical protein